MKPLTNQELKDQINRYHVAAIDPLLKVMDYDDVISSDLLYKTLNNAFFALITDQVEAAVGEAKVDVLNSVYEFFDDSQKNDIDKIIHNIESNKGDK